jgi:opacity protein-like surface antigen
MRSVAAAALLAAFALGPAAAQDWGAGRSDQVYFWEDSYRYGWSDSPQPTFGAPAPRILKRGVTLNEICARQVGRMMRIDNTSLIRSTQATAACVQNGGRL